MNGCRWWSRVKDRDSNYAVIIYYKDGQQSRYRRCRHRFSYRRTCADDTNIYNGI